MIEREIVDREEEETRNREAREQNSNNTSEGAPTNPSNDIIQIDSEANNNPSNEKT